MNLSCLEEEEEEEEEEGRKIGEGKPGENCNIRQGMLFLHAGISPKTKKSNYSPV